MGWCSPYLLRTLISLPELYQEYFFNIGGNAYKPGTEQTSIHCFVLRHLTRKLLLSFRKRSLIFYSTVDMVYNLPSSTRGFSDKGAMKTRSHSITVSFIISVKVPWRVSASQAHTSFVIVHPLSFWPCYRKWFNCGKREITLEDFHFRLVETAEKTQKSCFFFHLLVVLFHWHVDFTF